MFQGEILPYKSAIRLVDYQKQAEKSTVEDFIGYRQFIPTPCPRERLVRGTCTPSVPLKHTPVQVRSPCYIDRRCATASRKAGGQMVVANSRAAGLACGGFIIGIGNSDLVCSKHWMTPSLPREASGIVISPNAQRTLRAANWTLPPDQSGPLT